MGRQVEPSASCIDQVYVKYTQPSGYFQPGSMLYIGVFKASVTQGHNSQQAVLMYVRFAACADLIRADGMKDFKDFKDPTLFPPIA